ncbi:MAG TPA: fumarylacetoacetate hydrolase family protein [Acidimicrobiia bacterium]|nr:fumarylacetoacetate hydrolase family protein [Acidimicrobiia bacterium]
MRGIGVFSVDGGPTRVGWRVDGNVFDLTAEFDGLFEAGTLARLLDEGKPVWREAMSSIDTVIADAEPRPFASVVTHLPCTIGDYVDFYSSEYHATNVGRLFRPNADPLPSNWKHLPIGYHGRSGTIVVDGTPIHRPSGPRGPGDFGPTRKLDFELEVGFITGSGPSSPVPVEEAEEYIFGVVLVNDWSARDIQAWESQPLGPFLGKSFATTISPWVVPLTLLAEQRIDPPVQEPPPLPYLTPAGAGLDLELEVRLNSETVCRSNTSHLYWTMSQQLAHATSNGATIRAGDLFASGTVSGPDPGSLGCLLEITRNGETGAYLRDGDEVVLWSELLGSCGGRVVS